MKKVVAEVLRLSNNSLCPRVYCADQNGIEDEAISFTLCELVWEANGFPLAQLRALIEKSLNGHYVPKEPTLPDFSVNDKMVWITLPYAPHGSICISNENLPEYSMDDGAPQLFTLNQFKAVSKLAEDFALKLQEEGRENLCGQRFEMDLPKT